jgi:hypothetical protein
MKSKSLSEKENSKMENTSQFNPDLGSLARTAIAIDKIHRCADCPIRRQAIKRPHSIFARLHKWHLTWWPGWKAHQARACAFSTNPQNHI